MSALYLTGFGELEALFSTAVSFDLGHFKSSLRILFTLQAWELKT
jgi:hypothetical protein